MCSRPSTSLPLLMRWSVVASGFSASTIFVSSPVSSPAGRGHRPGFPAIFAYSFEIAAAGRATILAQQQLRPEQGYQLGRWRSAEWAIEDETFSHQPSAISHQPSALGWSNTV